MKTHPVLFLVRLSSFIFIFFDSQLIYQGAAIFNITSSRPLFPNETLISSNQIFELGFFSPDTNSDNMYIGIWYTNMSPAKIVWVANRNAPLGYSDRSSRLTIGSDDGNLKLLDGQGNNLWATNVSSSGDDSNLAVLLDSGNLVLRDDASSGIDYLWESFSNPSDTLLQTMKIEINVVTGNKQFLTCWKSEADPSPGDFVVGITSNTPPQMFTWINGSTPYWRSGPWDKSKFIGIQNMIETYNSTFSVQQDIHQGTTYFTTNSFNSTLLFYVHIASNGSLRLKYTNNRTEGWMIDSEAPLTLCDVYNTCGPFGVCNALNSPRVCSCLERFVPKSMEEWSRGNWSRGCTRVTELNCESNTSKLDVFLKMSQIKLPDSSYILDIISDAEDCSSWCLKECSCLAYSYVRTIGCMTWTNELLDIQQFNESGEDLFIRLDYINSDGDSRRKLQLVISLTVAAIIVVLGAALWALCTRKAKKNSISSWKEQLKGEDGQELPVFNFGSIVVATDNFSSQNKLGEGGFGYVYKGKLQDGKNVAVKRLSSNSGQGMEEFKTEILLISKLQHRNLVRLIGCCIKEEEKILIYEYLPNKSLDTFIFDPIKKMELSWDKRFQIIQGIARGLLYLHRDSHLRVIHRDLKASNILLDEKLNPKISDFGLARMFQGTQVLVNTRRVVGTLGYMAPEYAMGGIFSEKSDIYSFGVLLLEIVSSKKNTSFNNYEQDANLLSYTWRLWREGKALDLLEEQELLEPSSSAEIEKCIQVGLMCVQYHAVDRPHMSLVIQMLSGELSLLEPKEPAFTFRIKSSNQTPSHDQERLWYTYTATDSIIEGR